jgi:hypothetical protein
MFSFLKKENSKCYFIERHLNKLLKNEVRIFFQFDVKGVFNLLLLL